MYQHILIPTDGSELARTAVMQGLFFARSIRARVTVLTVLGAPRSSGAPNQIVYVPGTFTEEESDEAQAILREVRKDAAVVGISCQITSFRHARPYEAIISVANKLECDLIVMSSHGRSGVPAVFLGSVTHNVLAHSKIPVLVHRAIWPLA